MNTFCSCRTENVVLKRQEDFIFT